MHLNQSMTSQSTAPGIVARTTDPAAFGLVATDAGIENSGYLFVPHDSGDLNAGGIEGYFDTDAPDPRVLDLMVATQQAALSEIEADRRAVAESSASNGGRRPGSEQEMTAIVNLMIDELREVEFDLRRPVFVNQEHERTGPPLGAFRVQKRRKGRGIRISEFCTAASSPSVWIESRAAARLFRKRDVFFIGWGDGKCHFLPPTRNSWRGFSPQ